MMEEEKEIMKSSRFMLMEAADNAQILAELDGQMLKAMVYRVKGKDRLSYAGAKFAAIKLENIHVKETIITYNKELDQFEASALALNENINITLPGFAEQPRLMKVWDNKQKNESHLEVDEFARRKAAGKAVRNALMAVMPANHIAAYMRAAIEKGNIKTIKTVEVEQVPAKKPKARVGDPPRRTPPKPVAEKPKPQEEAPEISEPPSSLDEIEYRLRDHISDFDGTIKLGERPDAYRVYKVRHLGDDEFRMISDWIAQLGGLWSKEENCWKIQKRSEP